MDQEELKKKAAAFGQKALEVGKVVGKFSLKAGKEIAKEAMIAGKGLSEDLDNALKKLEKKGVDKSRLDNRKGTWHSKKIFPQTFEDAQTQLRFPLGTHRMNVHPDPTNKSNYSRLQLERGHRGLSEFISSNQPTARFHAGRCRDYSRILLVSNRLSKRAVHEQVDPNREQLVGSSAGRR